VKLSDHDARQRFGAARVANLATISAEGQPHLVPITFAFDRDVIYTAVDFKPKSTAQLRRLSNIRANPRVAVLADHYDEDWSALWWARADGMAAILDGRAEMTAPTELLTERYPQYRDNPPAGPVIAIRVARWTGWSAS
jgi:PPOX class probable F420-dependent enzyme